ncbi:hypothetical protein NEAUS05_1273 [Nematocida ausubeli]|nr:hypothetical protein NEAUS06_0387 [Nematocida ausubeli]KAI5135264.1 hypothetical protein NEAUS07_1100 [Nematocida ausubeli]KAI5148126.1 hypothetical protein NEAUS05_1273 [Nematocida ausubeli]
MAASIFATIKEVFLQRYTEITEQKLPRYTFRMSTKKRLTFYTGISLAAIACTCIIHFFLDSTSMITIDFSHCVTNKCEYSFTVKKPKTNTYMYGAVEGAAQTHMKYMREDPFYQGTPQDELNIDCTPYVVDGEWVYPCGIIRSTYPNDKYTLLNENNIMTIHADRNSQISSWSKSSSFSSAYFKIGKLDDLQPGEYKLIVEKQKSHPLPNRKVIFVSNVGIFGNLFYNSYIYMLGISAVLAFMNGLACMYYV